MDGNDGNGKLLTLADYAASRQVSYEAVRRQVVRYAHELGAHVMRQGRRQYLDEEAVRWLDGHRDKNIAIVLDRSSELDDALKEIEELKMQLAKQAILLESANAKAALVDQQKFLLEDLSKHLSAADKAAQAAEAAKDAAIERAHQAELKAAAAEAERDAANKTVERLRTRGLWARIRNKEV